MKQLILAAAAAIAVAGCHSAPQTPSNANGESAQTTSARSSPSGTSFGGYPDQVSWGKHLVQMSGCGDCHTPKVMSPMGPVPDTTMYLAGHPSQIPPPRINRAEIEKQGLMLTNDLTVWIGPWGISYAANLTPDETGIGGWTEAQFIRAIREGKWKGMENSRSLLPPMSFVAASLNQVANDEELKAIFAYLKTIKPVHNLVPGPEAPLHQAQHAHSAAQF
ncbi:MAG: diheme cytochrome c-553 [Thermoflavifilum sp.]|nr:diheme cytochrome c-553 [Thermoflavifilum sp.]